MQSATLAAPVVFRYVPAGHGVGLQEGHVQYEPIGQGARALAVALAVALTVALAIALAVIIVHASALAEPCGEVKPIGQGVGSVDENGQKNAAGHATGAPDAQYAPAGHAVHVALRTRGPFEK